jgi:hypothetical protein
MVYMVPFSRRRGVCWSAGYKGCEIDGSDGSVRLDSVDSIEEVSSDGDAGGVSGAERIDVGVVGRVVMTGGNLKIGEVEDGGVGGSSGCSGRGDGGKGAMERTVAIVWDGSRGAIFEGTPQSRSAIWPANVVRGSAAWVGLSL